MRDFFFPYSTASFPFLSTSNKSRRGKGFFLFLSACVLFVRVMYGPEVYVWCYIDDDDDDTPFILDVPQQRDIEIIMAVKESFFMNFFFSLLTAAAENIERWWSEWFIWEENFLLICNE